MADENTVQKILTAARAAERIKGEDGFFDQMVYGAFGAQAAFLNEQGYEAQIRWLLDHHYTAAAIQKALD